MARGTNQCIGPVARHVCLALALASSSSTLHAAPKDFGTWDLSHAFPGSGYYSGLANLPAASSYCSWISILGVTGSAVCQREASASPAGSAHIMSGMEAWDATGTRITGSMLNVGAFDALTGFLSPGYYDGTVVNLPSSSQIVVGNTVLGVAGTSKGNFSANTGSNASRDGGVSSVPHRELTSTSTQLTMEGENATYAGADLPSSGGLNYRDIPDESKDDDGVFGDTCVYAPRPASDCGKTQASIAARIADCASQNPSASSWDGATQCNRGQGLWKLVTRSGLNKEVWQDQRTGLLWSSRVGTSVNWCRASGAKTQSPVTYRAAYNDISGGLIVGNGTISSITGGAASLEEGVVIAFTSPTAFTVTGDAGASGCQGGSISSGALTTTAGSKVTWSNLNVCRFVITQGNVPFANGDTIILESRVASSYSCEAGAISTLQPVAAISYCAEDTGLNSPGGENWGAAVYSTAKGLMGKNSTPSVRWRLPTIEDYQQANINGIRMVMPDGGISGALRPTTDGSIGALGLMEWSASVDSYNRSWSYIFSMYNAYLDESRRYSLNAVRCVGR